MRNHVDIDHKHTDAIRQEIGERLRLYLRVESQLPTSLSKQIDMLHHLEGRSPSIVPDVEQGFDTKSDDNVAGQESRFAWLWGRKRWIKPG